MFDAIARRYDRANTVLSMGQDRRWRRIAVKMSGARRGDRVLDVACGTGPLARALARRVGPSGHVVGVDFSQQMLDVAGTRRHPRRAAPVEYQWADAQQLPFPDDGFDVATIAFGIRNVDEPRLAVSEMARVVAPGGRVVLLEFGQPRGMVGAGYRAYARHVMPRVGGWLTGQRAAYEYLPRTASEFPAGAAFERIMEEAHAFTSIASRPLMGGLVWCYVGIV